jgi:hypothetical protein
MRATLFALVSCLSGTSLFGGQPMYVAVCNSSGLPETAVSHAKKEIVLVFSAAGADIRWVGCVEVTTTKMELGNQLFVVRLRSDGPKSTSRNVALDTMGRAYTNERGSGYLADAYLPSINTCAEQNSVDRASLLGLVISHELGHLLLGPGHLPNGLMHGTWKSHETEAIRKRWLRFDGQQAAIIHRELEKRAEETPAEHASQN